jgi:short-subunit dehydrogenase
MIKRKRGHIVSISSLSAKITFYEMVAYAATKFGNDGLMSALYDDLCINDLEKVIRLTTVFPAFIKTQQKLVEYIKSKGDLVPMYNTDYVADIIIKGVLTNRRQIMAPQIAAVFLLLKYF